ncbi:hypothetical protein [Novosphingobium sp. ST904]|uniref:hypothetical protein n=1 Tax=Novosphingobium sp. ST904 TaxID=1684385 RepID=UPI0006C892D6|nr:hypothetical protein [Novosphingobium sp. ST904]KPH62327.1 hypothetical protein ADT71_15425 [Novosphingobium sp. ST904]TCM43329.1 hypothetical protein EDF59_101433 [Novosphingobium sp. ST904]
MKLDDFLLWLMSLFGGMALCGARLGWMLFGVAPEPPSDPVAFGLWQRKRRWLVFSELSALPAFATLSVVIGRLRDWPMEGVVLLSMVLGALGFAFFLDALQTIVRKRVGMDEGAPKDATP